MQIEKNISSNFFIFFEAIENVALESDFMDQDNPKESQEKKKTLKDALEQEKEKTQEYLRQLKYLQADFENYRKRTEKEIHDLTSQSNEKLVAELLCIIDDLERAVDSGKATNDAPALLKGVEMIHQNLARMLEREGLERIDAVGKIFDPKFHEIVAKIPRNDCEEGIVLEEVRRGFMFKGRVLRPCMVNVSCIDVEAKNNE